MPSRVDFHPDQIDESTIFSLDESRPFTIDAMLSHVNQHEAKSLNKENSDKQRGNTINDLDNLNFSYPLDRCIKPIDLSTTATDTSSPTNEQTASTSSSSSSSTTSSNSIPNVLPTAAAALNFFHIKNMIELTVESARCREKQLENEISSSHSFSIVFLQLSSPFF